MKSAFECYHHAARCEQQADKASDRIGRTALLVAARQWHALARVAKTRENKESQDPWPPREQSKH